MTRASQNDLLIFRGVVSLGKEKTGLVCPLFSMRPNGKASRRIYHWLRRLAPALNF
jgi:hypothetical protein